MKTRSRNGKLKAVTYEKEDSNGDEEDGNASASDLDSSSDDEPTSRPFKRRRTSHSTGSTSVAGGTVAMKGKLEGKVYRGKNVGKLSKLLDMPVDIFCEISMHLEPLDLLHLARSTKALNKLLMSRESKPIWRAARSYYPDLPDCPPDLSEPEYARLLFERDCHACLAPRAMKVDWVMRSRLCHRCRSSYILKGTQLIKTISHLTEQLLECIPCRNHQRRYITRYRRLEYFYSVRVRALVAKFRRAVPKGLSENEAKAIKEEFYKHHKELIKVIIDHASKVEKWLVSDRKTKHKAGSKAATRRRKELCAKLIDLGYKKEDFPKYWECESEWDAILDQPRDVTPRIWKSVRPRLEACIQKAKVHREEVARKKLIVKRWSEVSQHASALLSARKERDPQLSMHLQDVTKLPTVDALISTDDYRQEITVEKWEAARSQIEIEMDEYAEQARKMLIQLVVKARQKGSSQTDGVHSQLPENTSPEVDVDFLHLPTCLFSCTLCLNSDMMWTYPDILDHAHTLSSVDSMSARSMSWKGEDITFNPTGSLLAESILSSIFGQDQPQDRKLVLREMFQCARCDEKISDPMDWIALVYHYKKEKDWYDQSASFRRTNRTEVALHNEHDMDEAKLDSPLATVLTPEEASTQREKVQAFTAMGSKNFTCGLCQLIGWKTKQEIELHVKRSHLKDAPDEKDIRGLWGSFS